MSDNSINKLYFRLPSEKTARFIAKLKYDQVTGPKFLQAVIDGYLDDSEEFMNWWFTYKSTLKYPKIRLKARIKLINEGKELEKDFALNEEEIENIFDILENIED